jgi:hypothetical protein
MKIPKGAVYPVVLCFLLLTGTLSACRTGKELVKDINLKRNFKAWESPDLAKTQIRRVAILPFISHDLGHPAPEGEGVVCSFCGRPVSEHKDFSKAGERLALYLYEALLPISSYKLIPMEKVVSTLNVEGRPRDTLTKISALKEIGKELDVDALVTGEILRISERVGGNYSVITPASVSFRIVMIRVADGKELYRVLYDETQRPLSEEPELLFKPSKIRFRWQTADQLAHAGMREVAAVFPGSSTSSSR